MNTELFFEAYEGSWYTITGCGGDLDEWYKGYNDLLAHECHASDIAWHKFTGREYNEFFRLTGDNRYPDDLTFLCFPIDYIDVKKLAIFKIKMGDRWFNDVVDNDLRREGTAFDLMFASELVERHERKKAISR